MAVDDVLEPVVVELVSPPSDLAPRSGVVVYGQIDSGGENSGIIAEAVVPYPAVTGLGVLAWQLSLKRVGEQASDHTQSGGQCGIMVAAGCDLEAAASSTLGQRGITITPGRDLEAGASSTTELVKHRTVRKSSTTGGGSSSRKMGVSRARLAVRKDTPLVKAPARGLS